jgi:sodium/proline symporter
MITIYLWCFFAVFLAIMVWLSYIASSKTHNMADFAIGGATLGPYVLGLSYAATFFSAATFMGYPGYSYAWGYSNLWMFLALFISGALGIIAIGKGARKLNVSQNSLSLPDWLGDYYDSDILRAGSAAILLFGVFYISSQFAAGAQIFAGMLGFGYVTGLIVIAVIVMAYVFVGGSYADIYTDAVQAVLMAIAGVAVFVSGIAIFGDWNITQAFANITDNLASQDLNLVKVINPDSANYYSISAIAGLFVIQFAFASSPQLFNKVLALKNPGDLRKMIITYIVTALGCLVVLFGGLYARVAFPSLESADLSLIKYAEWGLPAIAAAGIGIVILSAALSTTDGLFVVISTALANDIYLKVLVKRGIIKTEKERANRIALKISRWSVIVVGIISGLIVLSPPKFLADLLWIGVGGVASGTFGPLLHAIYARGKGAKLAAEISMLIGFLSYLLFAFSGLVRSPMASGAWATVIGVVVMWILAAVFKPQEEA